MVLKLDQGTSFNTIKGNFIGTDITGLLARPNLYGISIISECTQNTIDSNVISGNAHYGLLFFENADSNIVTRNYIGPGADSTTAIGNGTVGVVLWNGSSYNQIGGVGQGNVIAYHDSCGIAVKDNTTLFNTFSENSIYENELMGIDIFPEGPNANDADDTDSGPNELMNHPLIWQPEFIPWAHQLTIAGSIQMSGTADSIVVEVFEAAPDSLINCGEAKRFIGRTICSTMGEWLISVPWTDEGTIITATATSVGGSTSEFAPNITAITSLDEILQRNVTVFPNPASDYILVSAPGEGIRSISVFTFDGRKVFEQTGLDENHFDWSFGNELQSGVYVVRVITADGSRLVSKFDVVR